MTNQFERLNNIKYVGRQATNYIICKSKQHRHRRAAPGRFISDPIRVEQLLNHWTEYAWGWFLYMNNILWRGGIYRCHQLYVFV